MNRTSAFIASIAMSFAATTAVAQQPAMKVNVLIVESLDDFTRWLSQKPAPQGPYPPSLKEIPAGKKVHFPILVQNLRPPERGVVDLVADVEFFGPDGKSIYAGPKCCRFTITNRPDIRTAMLGGTPNLELESTDVKGTYTVRVSVTDGSQTATAGEKFQYGAGKLPTPQVSTPTAAPKLQMGTPPAKNPGRDADKRDCLTLPSPAEVIKCTERK